MGRPPKYGKAMSAAQVQREYWVQRQHEAAEVARALVAIVTRFPETRQLVRGEDVRRGVAYLLRADETGAADYFNRLMPPPARN